MRSSRIDKFFIFIFWGYVRDSDITLVYRDKDEVRWEGLIQQKVQMGTRTQRGHRSPVIMTPRWAGHLVFDPKLDLRYRNCSDAGIFASAVVSPFRFTPGELTEGILS